MFLIICRFSFTTHSPCFHFSWHDLNKNDPCGREDVLSCRTNTSEFNNSTLFSAGDLFHIFFHYLKGTETIPSHWQNSLIPFVIKYSFSMFAHRVRDNIGVEVCLHYKNIYQILKVGFFEKSPELWSAGRILRNNWKTHSKKRYDINVCQIRIWGDTN